MVKPSFFLFFVGAAIIFGRFWQDEIFNFWFCLFAEILKVIKKFEKANYFIKFNCVIENKLENIF